MFLSYLAPISILLIIASSSTSSSSIYSAVTSKVIRPFSSHNVSLFVEPGGEKPLRFSAVVNSFTESYSSKEVTVNPSDSLQLSIPIGDLKESKYNLTLKVTDSAGNVEENKTIVYPAAADETLFLQTDKPVYKPGETVRFRIISLNRDLQPVDDLNLNIRTTDPEGNVIKIWPDAASTNGLFKGELELSSDTILGNWRIDVTAMPSPKQRKLDLQASEGTQEKIAVDAEASTLIGLPPPNDIDYDDDYREKTLKASLDFTVDQYVLPKFEVIITLPPFLTFNETKVQVEVKAKYTYGKGVAGEVTLNTRLPYYYQSNEKKLSTTLPVKNGAAIMEVDVKDLFVGQDIYETDVQFDASVTENVTGIVRNGTAQVRVYRYPYKIEPMERANSVKPGLPYKIAFQVTTQDGKPISDPSPSALTVSHGFSYRSQDGTIETSIPEDGVVNLTFDPPTNELIQVQRIELKFRELTRVFYVPQKENSDSQAYMQLILNSTEVPAGGPIKYIVNATKGFLSVNTILSNGQEILSAEKVSYGTARLEEALTALAPEKGSPQVRILVFVVLPDGNVLADSATFKVIGSSGGNFLNVSAPSDGEPGDNVTLTLTSSPNSIVALRGVDQSVLLLRDEDTDLTQKALDSKINERNDRVTGRHRIWGGSSAFQVFEEGGLSILTNAKLSVRTNPWSSRISLNKYHDDNFAFAAPLEAAVAPLAAPVRIALAGAGASSGGSMEIRVRSNFVETWIWEEVPLNGSTAEIVKTLPDTLTSWVITGFSLSADKGIGILQEPTKITTSRPFFLTLNLPYSVVKGETLVLQVLVHNYLGQEVTAEVTLDNSQSEFQFAEKSLKDAKVGKKVVSSKGNSVMSVEFPIIPRRLGAIMLNVKGITGLAGDALSRPLRVKPPGKRFRRSEASLINPSTDKNLAPTEMTLSFPEKRVEGADVVKVSIIGDILGQTAANLDKLINLPTGCGEQNMMQFVADIVILDYLNSSNSLVEAVKSKAVRFLQTGYQRELTYKHPDGSFSAFGTNDPAGSTWLTAFVVRSFIAAQPHIFIDDMVVAMSLKFLMKQQLDNGGFFETGKVLHSDIQGGSGSTGVALAAYVTLAFIEAQAWRNKHIPPHNGSAPSFYAHHIEKALNFITNQTASADDPYALVISTYALHLANHSAKDEFFERMEKLSKTEGGFKFWKVPEINKTLLQNETELYHWRQFDTKPVNVEMTSYALLTYLMRDKAAEAFPIVRWLLRQRNPSGGFISTQDTVVGLTALGKYAQLTKNPTTDLTVDIDDGKQKRSVSIKDADAEVLHQIILPAETRKVTTSASGKGTVLVALDWEFYVEEPEEKPAFKLDVKASGDSGMLKLKTCAEYLGNGESNMAIVELNFPSGYVVERDALSDLKEVPQYKRHDLENGDSRISVYFESLSANSTCFTVSGNRLFKVGNQAAAYVTAYDYYDTTKRATVYYEPPKVSICDICQENADCDMNNCI